MAMKQTTDLTKLSPEELAGKKKSLQGVLGVLWSLCGVYLIYLIYRLSTMESGEDMGSLALLGSGLAMLGAVSAIIGAQFGKFKAEEKRRAGQV